MAGDGGGKQSESPCVRFQGLSRVHRIGVIPSQQLSVISSQSNKSRTLGPYWGNTCRRPLHTTDSMDFYCLLGISHAICFKKSYALLLNELESPFRRAHRPGRPFSKDRLQRSVWGGSVTQETTTRSRVLPTVRHTNGGLQLNVYLFQSPKESTTMERPDRSGV